MARKGTESKRQTGRTLTCRPAALCGLILLILVPYLGLGATYYARPPFNIRFWWPDRDWRFSLHSEAGVLQASLVKGSGEKEQGGLAIRGYPLQALADPEALILFHWLMDEEHRRRADNFARLAGPYGAPVGGKQGYRTDIRETLHGHEMKGSIISFAHQGIFYNLVFVAFSAVYDALNTEIGNMLERIEFLESPHPLTRYTPAELLGKKMPIREVVWPRRTAGGFLPSPSLVCYGADERSETFLKVTEEASVSAADSKPGGMLADAAQEFERDFGKLNWEISTFIVYGVRVHRWDTQIKHAGTELYLGLASWTVGKRVYLLWVLGFVEGLSRLSLTEAVKAVVEEERR